MVRINEKGNVLFYRGRHGILNQIYYEGTAWHNREIKIAGTPLSFLGPFDITPDCTKDDAQIYFRGQDGYVNVTFSSGGNWIAGPVIYKCGPEPQYKKCRENGFIKYANGTVLYEATGMVESTIFRPILHPGAPIQAYYFGKCDSEHSIYI